MSKHTLPEYFLFHFLPLPLSAAPAFGQQRSAAHLPQKGETGLQMFWPKATSTVFNSIQYLRAKSPCKIGRAHV